MRLKTSTQSRLGGRTISSADLTPATPGGGGQDASIRGVFHWISRKHLVRYACETSFRWNRRAAEAPERLREMLHHACGRRLSYAALVGAAA